MNQPEPTTADDEGRERTGRNLESLRKSKGWSQTQLAERMVEAGETHFRQTTVSRLERGLQPLRMSDIKALQEVFGAEASRIWMNTDAAAKHKLWIDSIIMSDARQLIEEKIAKIAQELDELRELFGIFTEATSRSAGVDEDGEHQEEA